MSEEFLYNLGQDTRVFQSSIRKEAPYTHPVARDHESLFFVTNGAMLYVNNGVSTVVKKGQVGYIGSGDTGTCFALDCDLVSYIAMNFSFDNACNLTHKLPFGVLCSKGDVYNFEKLFKKALESFSFSGQRAGFLAVTSGIILEILGRLYNEYFLGDANLLKMQRIENAVTFMRENLSDCELKISAISNIVGVSEKQFRRIFFDVYQKTPLAFLRQLRIDKAEALLLSTADTVSDIALACGFSDVYSFSHSFKNHHCISPSEFRKHII